MSLAHARATVDTTTHRPANRPAFVSGASGQCELDRRRGAERSFGLARATISANGLYTPRLRCFPAIRCKSRIMATSRGDPAAAATYTAIGDPRLRPGSHPGNRQHARQEELGSGKGRDRRGQFRLDPLEARNVDRDEARSILATAMAALAKPGAPIPTAPIPPAPQPIRLRVCPPCRAVLRCFWWGLPQEMPHSVAALHILLNGALGFNSSGLREPGGPDGLRRVGFIRGQRQ